MVVLMSIRSISKLKLKYLPEKMNTTIKNVSLIANVFLVVLLGISILILGIVHYQSNKEIIQLKKKGNILEEQHFLYEEMIVANLISSRLYLGMKFPKIDFKSLNGEKISTDLSNKMGGIVLLFFAGPCQSCLNAQLKILSHIHKNLRSSRDFQIIAISDEMPEILKKYKDAFSLPFPVVSDRGGTLFKEDSIFVERTTLVLHINSDNTIIKAHIPIPENPRLSALFFNEIQGSLPMRNLLFNGHFDGVRIIDVLRNDIDMEPIHRLLF